MSEAVSQTAGPTNSLGSGYSLGDATAIKQEDLRDDNSWQLPQTPAPERVVQPAVAATPAGDATEIIKRTTNSSSATPLSSATPVPQRRSHSPSVVGGSPYPLSFANAVSNAQTTTIERDVVDSALQEGGDPAGAEEDEDEGSRISAYARLDFQTSTFYVQTLQVILGRRTENSTNMVDVHLGTEKAISRKHAKIFYNFGTQRFELSVLGRNGAFVNDVFVQADSTVPLKHETRIEIGKIAFTFNLPSIPAGQAEEMADSPSSDLLGNDEDADTDGAMFSAINSHGPITGTEFTPVPGEEYIDPSIAAVSSSLSHEPAPKKQPRREYLPEEIPPEYREKPNHSYSHLIATALREYKMEGMSLANIYLAIQEIFPFYKYCPHGWQNSVRHNLSSNKAFKKVAKEGKGWLWGLDEEYLAEKEAQKRRVQEAKMASRQAAAERAQQERDAAAAAAAAAQREAAIKQELESKPGPQSISAQLASVPRRSTGPRPKQTTGVDQITLTAITVAAKLVNLELPVENFKIMALLQQKIQAQVQSMGSAAGKPENAALLTNSLALAIVQAAKEAGGTPAALTTLLSGKDPTQLAKILKQALASFNSKMRQAASTANSTDAATSASAADVKSQSPAPAAPAPSQSPTPAQTGAASPAPSAASTTQSSGGLGIPGLSLAPGQKLTLASIEALLAKASAIPNPAPNIKEALRALEMHAKKLREAEGKRSAQSAGLPLNESEPNKAVKHE